jgi:hypothetical protein
MLNKTRSNQQTKRRNKKKVSQIDLFRELISRLPVAGISPPEANIADTHPAGLYLTAYIMHK